MKTPTVDPLTITLPAASRAYLQCIEISPAAGMVPYVTLHPGMHLRFDGDLDSVIDWAMSIARQAREELQRRAAAADALATVDAQASAGVR